MIKPAIYKRQRYSSSYIHQSEMAVEKNRQFLSINVEILKFTSLWHETDQVNNKRKCVKILAITLALSSTFTPLFCEFIAVLIGKKIQPKG